MRHSPLYHLGFALPLLLTLLVAFSSYFMVNQLNAFHPEIQYEQTTTHALAQAKEALISYAMSVDVTPNLPPKQLCTVPQCPRPGDLPCPDTDNDGDAESSCNSNTLGRLPWKTLGLPEQDKGTGERLWYAVSRNFKNNTRTGKLNQDTLGDTLIRNTDGSILYDGTGLTNTKGVAAIIIAPGHPIMRPEGLQQTRGIENMNKAIHYLDAINDRIQVLTQTELMSYVMQRVTREVLNCLKTNAQTCNALTDPSTWFGYNWGQQTFDVTPQVSVHK